MPHSRPGTDRFVRSNGGFTVQMLAGDAKLGLPYGSTPRLVLAWMTTEAVKTKNPELQLGASFSAFLHDVGIIPVGQHVSGGKRGTRTYAQRQTMALFNAIVSWHYTDNRSYRGSNIPIASEFSLAWDPLRADQETLWTSTVTMGSAFFEEVTSRPVPVDFRALKLFKRSPITTTAWPKCVPVEAARLCGPRSHGSRAGRLMPDRVGRRTRACRCSSTTYATTRLNFPITLLKVSLTFIAHTFAGCRRHR